MSRLASAFAVLALAASGCAFADARGALHEAFGKFLAAKSFRATVTDVKRGKMISQMEYVAPDRYHMQTGDGPETFIIGDDAYMDMDGRLMKMPIPVGKIVGQYRNEKTLKQFESEISVTDLGSDSVDGEAAHAYAFTQAEPKSDSKVWISEKSGLPIQIESQGSFMGVKSTTRVRYSNFDDPSIRIAMPRD